MRAGCLAPQLILVFGIVAAAVGMIMVGPILLATETPLTLMDVEAFIGFRVPPDARDIHFTDRTGLDTELFVSFTMPSSQLDSFLSAFPTGLNLQQGFSPFQWGTDGDWWRPNEAKLFAGAEYEPDGMIYSLLVDETDSQEYVIYLEVGTDHNRLQQTTSATETQP